MCVELYSRRLPMIKPMTLSDLLGYLRTWSAYQDWRKANADSADVVDELGRDFLAAVPGLTMDSNVDVEWPVFVVLSRK